MDLFGIVKVTDGWGSVGEREGEVLGKEKVEG